jgi:outer membrane protein TolC
VLAVSDMLEAERLAKVAELALLTTEEEYEQNLIDLYVALGGPWIQQAG